MGVTHRFDHVPYEQDEFVWAADHFLREDTITKVAVIVRGRAEVVERDQVRKIDPFAATGLLWCPIANMVRERSYGPGGNEIKHGSKHFAPGAKLYLIGMVGWAPHVQVNVVGQHRKTHQYISMTMRAAGLTNWRVSLVYSPHVIAELWPAWDGSEVSKIRAEEFVARVRQIGIEARKTVPGCHEMRLLSTL